MKKKRFNTEAVHGGESRDPRTGAVNTPIYLTSTFGFDTLEEQNEAVADHKSRYLYTRWCNPTIDAACRKMAILEQGEDALVLASGMAAISAVFLTQLRSGDHIVAMEDLYGGTLTLFNQILPRFNIDITYVPGHDLKRMEAAIRPGITRMLYVESPTNPLLNLVDLEEVARIAHSGDCLAVCDNTFATPVNQNPLTLGFDLVCHSGTKYLGGHSDITVGVVVGSSEMINRLWFHTITLGGTTNADTAWLLLRGLKTLGIRVKQHNQNALDIARFLEEHPKIRRVYYPGLTGHAQHRLAKKQMSGFGGMLSFEIDTSAEGTRRFLENIDIFEFAPSLGGTDSLLTPPALTSHSYISQEDRDKLGISDSLIRMSVGIEDAADLIAALDKTLRNI